MPRYSREEAFDAVGLARSWTDALGKLGMCRTGGNAHTLKKWVAAWGISTAHFDHDGPRTMHRRAPTPLESILVQGSTYHRGHLKERLYGAGLKQRCCELCGQGESWQGRQMALILDHINGVADDHRLENLRIVCPNCAATLDTHCGRKLRLAAKSCGLCAATFQPKYARQRFCSRSCALCAPKPFRGRPNTARRKVERPPHDRLVADVRAAGYEATGRRYGVSGNAIRKWIRQYESEAETSASARSTLESQEDQ